MRSGAKTVSYTHLDVYKRQAQMADRILQIEDGKIVSDSGLV